MKTKQTAIVSEQIEKLIFVIRGQRVMLDSDLARIYGVETKALNRAVKRNIERFPEDFVFQLTRQEAEALRCQIGTSNVRSQFVTSKGRGGRRYLPYAFTEHGAVMAANVLNSEQAVAMSMFVVRAFIRLREVLAGSRELAKKLTDLERKLTARLDVHEEAILQLFAEIRNLLSPPPPQPEPKKRRIGFLGEDEEKE
jgi:predicted amino acid-binding ACT domain protein